MDEGIGGELVFKIFVLVWVFRILKELGYEKFFVDWRREKLRV